MVVTACKNDPKNPAPELCEGCARIADGPTRHEVKQHFRGCCNCAWFDAERELCRRHPPFQPVKPADWCKEWAWVCNSRHTWNGKVFPGEVHHPDQVHKHLLEVAP
jgi:hypothetical protein